jgi:hypothetical protein
LSRPLRHLATAVAVLASGALVGLGTAGGPAGGRAGCTPALGNPSGPDHGGPAELTLPAAALAVPVPVADCDLRGARVVAGALVARVPQRDGEFVTAVGAAGGGHPAALTVWVAGGAATARIWRPDPAPTAPRIIERLGPARPRDLASDGSGGPAPGSPEAAVRGRCADPTGTWLGMRWPGPYRWSFNPRGVPGYLRPVEPVRAAVLGAARNVDDGRNDCGLTGGLAVSQQYLGETDRGVGVAADGGCGERDGRNVVAFGRLTGGLLAVTCLWWVRGGRTVEADIRVNTEPGVFALDPAPGCGQRWDLEGTLTHEFGHVFGLGHVPYAQHGELTMSDGLPSCSTRFRGLGLGDFLTLREHYGAG